MAEPHRIKGEGISFRDGRGLLALGTRRRRLHSPASKGFLGWDFQGQPITEGSPTLCSLGKGEMGGAEPPAAPWGWGARPTAPPPPAVVHPQLAAAVQMFPSLAALGVEAVGSGGGAGPGPPAAAAQGPAGPAVDAVAPGRPAELGMEATHTGPAGPELPEGQSL